MKKQLLLASVAFALIAANDAPKAPPMITAKDKATYLKDHDALVAEFGGLYDGPQVAYVTKVGQKIALQSGMSNAESDFNISLLNSSINNAFAIPGGYVHITRQLIGLMNNEAEMASVLGHEIGHVAARHAQKRNSRATLGGLGTLAATVLGGVLGGTDGAKLGQQLGGNIATRVVLGYSRSQEYEADDLGVAYLAKAGYDPSAASSMLASLAAQTSLDTRISGSGESTLPKWASTHPDPASRVVRAAQKASATGSTSKVTNRDQFLTAIDSMMYDDDPKQGVVEGQVFKHPDLKLTFTAPNGFGLTNGASAVAVSGSTGQAEFSSGPYTGDLSAYISAVYKAKGGDPATLGSVSTSDVNGLKSAHVSADVAGQSGSRTVTIYAYEWAGDSAFHFISVRAAGSADPFANMYQSIRRLSASDAAAIKPRKIDVVTVKSGDTVASLSAKMAYPNFKEDRFRVINALTPTATLNPGQTVKIVTY